MFNGLKWQSLLLISTCFFILSCSNKSAKDSEELLSKMKTYSYIEVISQDGVFGAPMIEEKEPIEIQETSDTLAYLEAYKKFSISQQAISMAAERLGSSGINMQAKEFKLLNDAGVDIVPNIKFSTKDLKEKEIKDRLSKIREKHSSDVVSDEKQPEVDSLMVNQLISKFDIKKEEFSNENLSWYKPKTAPKYINQNGIYCYFQTKNGKASNLRLQVQYVLANGCSSKM